ncbi:MAG: hypothetical protein A2341_06555 [Deltaproteobacteria bacterium RIFOXYB12_FULL_58_9]|nr:MAG: hypothetical protein A2341_06555 [Deltaproteobacteria bacterium RIFOXYB12_FULL_58_9]
MLKFETAYLEVHLETFLSSPGFQNMLALGKYSRWACGFSAGRICIILCAIDFLRELREPGSSSAPFSDEEKRLFGLFNILCWSTEWNENAARPEQVGDWARELDPEDLLGVLWHLGNFTFRYGSRFESPDRLHPRCQEGFCALVSVVHGKPTTYTIEGQAHPLTKRAWRGVN